MTIAFGTKAETLVRLTEAGFNVPKTLYFTVGDWTKAEAATVRLVIEAFGSSADRIAVRSSSRLEDTATATMAGAFKTVLNVPLLAERVQQAISVVVNSYDGDPEHQVLIQPMVRDVMLTGVIMTRRIDDGAPYYVFSYDDVSGKTDTVTGGVGESKTVSVYKNAEESDCDSPRIAAMLGFARRLEKVFESVALDIEFVMDRANTIHLLQVRRIRPTSEWRAEIDSEADKIVKSVEQFVAEYVGPRDGLLGKRTILGVMPDWNPAEIIGTTPRPLAASLYREVITRRVWSQARELMGYRAVPATELMVLISGQPYIDVRASFNSLLPAGLDDAVGETLIDAWIDRLDAHPECHDKVEFEIAFTIHDLQFDRAFDERYPGLLNPVQRRHFKERMQALTNRCLDPGSQGSLTSACNAVDELARRQAGSQDRPDDTSAGQLLVTVQRRLEECQELGTRPFAVLARHGFIAESFLRSLVSHGALSQDRVGELKRSVRTISREMAEDFRRVCDGTQSRESFMRRYGHLRPGTYDILSPRYVDRPELFDRAVPLEAHSARGDEFTLTPSERRSIEMLLAANGITAVDAGLIDYVRRAIVGREHSKFVFTRTLSNCIEAIATWGSRLGLTREDLSMLTLADILGSTSTAGPAAGATELVAISQGRRQDYEIGRRIKLSYIIRSTRDVHIVPQHRTAPNFITDKRVQGEVAVLGAQSRADLAIRDRIVCIENADPGFDWIFAKGIAGLVTKYGGANSHMAVRCAEFGLPAAIGCGELLFERTCQHPFCEIDGGSRILRPLGSIDSARSLHG